MPITVATILWALFGVLSVSGLFFFNKGLTIWSFITDRTHLVLFIIASLFGMRENYSWAFIFLAIAFLVMWYSYSSFKCQYICKYKER